MKYVTHLKIYIFAFENAENFNYLPFCLNAGSKMNIEIAERIAKGNNAYCANAKGNNAYCANAKGNNAYCANAKGNNAYCANSKGNNAYCANAKGNKAYCDNAKGNNAYCANAKGNKAYCANAKLIKSKFLTKDTKMKMYKTMIRPVVTHLSETWALTAKDTQL